MDLKDSKVTPFCVCALVIKKKRGFSIFFSVCLALERFYAYIGTLGYH